MGFFYVTLQIFKVYVGVPPRKASGQAIRSKSALAKPRLRAFHFYPSREQPPKYYAFTPQMCQPILLSRKNKRLIINYVFQKVVSTRMLKKLT